jgi:peptide deformylase
MAIRAILRYPAPELRQVCRPVTEPSPELAALVGDLCETLESLPGCVGIAAPQVGALIRLVVVDVSRYRKPAPNQGRMILVNPSPVFRSGHGIFREGCLSLPDYTANIARATEVEVQALDDRLQPRPVRASGFEAVVIQHELDHLDGILFIDRVACVKTDLFRRKTYAM